MGALGLAACLAAAGALPAVAQDAKRVPVEQATTRQKADFVRNLLTRSISARTIEDKGDAAAKANLARARALVDEAHADVAAARYEAANGKLDQALLLVNTEARKLSEAEVKGQRLRAAYDKRRNSVVIFLSAYERVAGEKELSAATMAQVEELRRLLRKAEKLKAAGRIIEANDVLERAYRTARGDIREMREGKTLVRSLNFETPAAEYRYEHDRNDSHIMLLQFAIANKNPPKARRTRIDVLRRQAMGLRDEAESQARAGDHVSAIETLTRSTNSLLKAIRMSGVWIPG
ncbi:MAG: hypothetical protein ACE5FR_04630 [Rhodospirillales bacterium]